MDRRLELDPMESDLGSGERLVLRPARGDSEPLEAEREALLRRGCTAISTWSPSAPVCSFSRIMSLRVIPASELGLLLNCVALAETEDC